MAPQHEAPILQLSPRALQNPAPGSFRLTPHAAPHTPPHYVACTACTTILSTLPSGRTWDNCSKACLDTTSLMRPFLTHFESVLFPIHPTARWGNLSPGMYPILLCIHGISPGSELPERRTQPGLAHLCSSPRSSPHPINILNTKPLLTPPSWACVLSLCQLSPSSAPCIFC